MHRRDILRAGAAVALAPAPLAMAAEAKPLRTRARDAWIYALPLIEMATIRSRSAVQGQNVLLAGRTLATAESRVVTTPNNDTLYSTAWLDLSSGPLTLTFKPGDRYQSVHVLNMYTDSDAVLSRRTIGAGGVLEIVGPGTRPHTKSAVRVTTPQAWVIVRTLIDGPADLSAAHTAQDAVTVSGPRIGAVPAFALRDAPPQGFFESAVALMAANPPPRADRAFLKANGLLRADALKALTSAQWDDVAQGVKDARALVASVLTSPNYVDGWSVPRANLGLFGTDYLYRAAVALGGIGALTPNEAMYFSPAGDTGYGEFRGDGLYKMTVPADFPVSAFWSMTMYEVTPAKQRFLTPNPLNRYSIGDRTQGLVRNADGSIDIWIGRTDPGGARTSNWLPAPAQGPYALSLRAYWPKPELISGRVRLPPLVAV